MTEEDEEDAEDTTTTYLIVVQHMYRTQSTRTITNTVHTPQKLDINVRKHCPRVITTIEGMSLSSLHDGITEAITMSKPGETCLPKSPPGRQKRHRQKRPFLHTPCLVASRLVSSHIYILFFRLSLCIRSNVVLVFNRHTLRLYWVSISAILVALCHNTLDETGRKLTMWLTL
jgi:hypothetical protein